MNTTLEIQNLKCDGCANTIIKKLSSFDTLKDIHIDKETSTVSFDYDNENILVEVKKVLAGLGYPVVGDQNKITTKVKSYLSCAIGRTTSG